MPLCCVWIQQWREMGNINPWRRMNAFIAPQLYTKTQAIKEDCSVKMSTASTTAVLENGIVVKWPSAYFWLCQRQGFCCCSLCPICFVFAVDRVLKHRLITGQRAENKRVECSFLNRPGRRNIYINSPIQSGSRNIMEEPEDGAWRVVWLNVLLMQRGICNHGSCTRLTWDLAHQHLTFIRLGAQETLSLPKEIVD